MESYEMVAEWADGTWCFMDEMNQMNHMSDDFQVIVYNIERHI